MKTKFEKLDNGEMKMIITIDKDEFEKYKINGLKKVQEFVQIDGFRKGNAPENLIIQKYGEMIILEEMGHLAINETYYTSIIKENENRKENEKIFPISEPKINITKIGQGSEFEYNATFPIMPEIKLANYKKISKEIIEETEKQALEELRKKNDKANKEDILEVSEEEVEDVLKTLQKGRNAGAHIHEDGTVHTEGHNNEEEKIKEDIKEDLPALDDTFAQSFGENFKTLNDLKTKVKENLTLEKKSKLIERKRTNILEKLVSETKIIIPEALIKDELERMKAQMKADVERFGGKWEDYLIHLKKTEEDLKEEWKDVANKRVSSQLIVSQIAKEENIKITKEEIDIEAIKILSQMPDANENHVNSYIEQILTNEKVMRILDGEDK